MSDPRYPELYEKDEVRKSKSGVIQYVFTVILGKALPIRYSGKLYLVRELQKCGMNTSIIPEACLRELTVEAIRQCKEQSRFESRRWQGAITQYIEQIAFLITCRLGGDDVYMSAMSWPSQFVDILRKHGVIPDAIASPQRAAP